MTRPMIPIETKMVTVDMTTGEETPGTTTMMLMPAKLGHCEMCGAEHEPELPHNAQSLFYGVRFSALHGRSPNWLDATEHCTPEMRDMWLNALIDMGVNVHAGDLEPS
jgi:hypothetical protein